jgi:Conserved TM helix
VPTFLSNALDLVVTFVPKLLLALVILVVGYFIARLLAAAVNKLLERVGFDRLGERGGLKPALARANLDASDVIAKIVFWAIMLLTLQFAFGVVGPNPISSLLATIIGYLPNVIVAIIIVIIAAAIAQAVRTLLLALLGGLSFGPALANIASVFVIFLGVIAALNQVGIALTVTTPVLIAVLATVAGVIIVGVGGGLIRPMQQRWEGYLNRVEEEAPRARAARQGAQPTTGTTRTMPAANGNGTTTGTATRTRSTTRPSRARAIPDTKNDGSQL